ncbi:Exosome complex exonuclease RRP44 [Blattella germanica]|nr:Exosome complex exonuclease RRP44 [Blattella germanica]
MMLFIAENWRMEIMRGNEERFAFSCIWEITKDAEIIDTKYCKSIILSRRAMTYEEAQIKIDDPTQQDSLANALVLASPEIRFHVDSETSDPIDVVAKKILETNSMVEEFMLLANVSVATKILEDFPECAMLRRHPTPPISNFEPLIKAGRKLVCLAVDRINIIVHRLLAVSIGADVTYPDLLDKRKSQAVSHNLNYRNRMAQYAGRASVALHTHLFFREKVQDEQGYVLFVRKNALQILIPKYGLEGTLYVNPRKGEKFSVQFTYNHEIPGFSVPSLESKRKENDEEMITEGTSKKTKSSKKLKTKE